MKIEDKLELLTTIINSCENVDQLSVVRNWIRVTTYWSDDIKLKNTAYKLVEVADVNDYFDKLGDLEFYECDKYIKKIKEKRGVR